MCRRRRREIQFSLLSFITPFLVHPQGLLRGADLGLGPILHPSTVSRHRWHHKVKTPPLTACLKRLTPLYKIPPPHTHIHEDPQTWQTLQANSAYSHIPEVPVLAFPDLKHVLPQWDVTSLNTHFLSPCF